MASISQRQLEQDELIISDLKRQFASPTKFVTKRLEGERENVVEVPVTEEDRVAWCRRLQMMETERERFMKELGLQ